MIKNLLIRYPRFNIQLFFDRRIICRAMKVNMALWSRVIDTYCVGLGAVARQAECFVPVVIEAVGPGYVSIRSPDKSLW